MESNEKTRKIAEEAARIAKEIMHEHYVIMSEYFYGKSKIELIPILKIHAMVTIKVLQFATQGPTLDENLKKINYSPFFESIEDQAEHQVNFYKWEHEPPIWEYKLSTKSKFNEILDMHANVDYKFFLEILTKDNKEELYDMLRNYLIGYSEINEISN